MNIDSIIIKPVGKSDLPIFGKLINAGNLDAAKLRLALRLLTPEQEKSIKIWDLMKLVSFLKEIYKWK